MRCPTSKIDSFTGPNRFLSNFYRLAIPISFGGRRYPTVEHAFQASKTLRSEEIELIHRSSDPGVAKRIGRQVTLRPDWEDIKLSTMEYLLWQKFADPVLQQLLVETGDAELIEGNNWGDRFWGVDGTGENHLGKLLMKLRHEYAKSYPKDDPPPSPAHPSAGEAPRTAC